MSFRDKVIQSEKERHDSLAGHYEDFELTDDDVTIYRSDSMPSIEFSSRIQEELAKQWKSTVIVKLLGRPIGYGNICNRLDSMWNFTQGFDVIDLENDYFLVKFKSGADVEAVLTGGPWIILGHYLSVQVWNTQFDCTKDCIQSIQAWIRIPGMPIHYYNKKVLRYIGQMVGRVIKIDYFTEAAERGKFARIAVDLDLNKPLVSQFCLDGKVQFVEYECLPRICFNCGKFGHVKEKCPEIIINNQVNSSSIMEGQNNVQKTPAAVTGENANPSFGPWMMVNKKRRSTTSNGNKNNLHRGKSSNVNNQRGSRFQILERDNVEDITEISNNPVIVEENLERNSLPQYMGSKQISHANFDKNAPKDNDSLSYLKSSEDARIGSSQQPKTRFIVNKVQTSLDSSKHTAVNVIYNSSTVNQERTISTTSMEKMDSDIVHFPNKKSIPPDREDIGGHLQTNIIDPCLSLLENSNIEMAMMEEFIDTDGKMMARGEDMEGVSHTPL